MAPVSALEPHPSIAKPDAPELVCILDGWGENKVKDEYNAVHVAATPTTDAMKHVPGRWRTVRAHGTAVGLPSDADMGNSEVGHNALGALPPKPQGPWESAPAQYLRRTCCSPRSMPHCCAAVVCSCGHSPYARALARCCRHTSTTC